jgi:integrase/recombinase XerD
MGSSGLDAQVAVEQKIRRERILAAQAAGLIPTENEEQEPTALIIKVREYLRETKNHKSWKTFLAYRLTLVSFAKSCDAAVEKVTRDHIMTWIGTMKEEGLDPRTITNRVANLKTFWLHFDATWPFKKKDKPRYTPKPPKPYTALEIKRMLAEATEDELDLVMFFYGSGGREQEVQYATWRDISFERSTFSITEKNDAELRWTPKDKEQGEVPLTPELVERLRRRRARYPDTRLIFPGPNGKPDGHLLRIIKWLALRAGVNCGECINKKGESCKTHPVCERAILHRFRKSFATAMSNAGVNVRTIQAWLRHSSLDTTLSYLKESENDDQGMRAKVGSAFAHLS